LTLSLPSQQFIDADGKTSGDRWIYIDPKGKRGEDSDDGEGAGAKGCCIM
jgi:hypothetical protein